jgi:hypothetical protein
MKDYFVSFALHMDPNIYSTIPSKPTWPKFTPDKEMVLTTTPGDIEVTKDPDSNERCKALRVLAN